MGEVGWTTGDDWSTRWFVVAEQKGGLRDDLHTPSQNNPAPTTMDDPGHPKSRPSFSDSDDDEDIEMVGLEEIAMTPQKATHAIDNDSESSDDEDDAGRGLLASGSQRRPVHAHTRSLSLNRGINIWQQVRNIVIEVSGNLPTTHYNPSCPIDRTYALVHDGGHHVHWKVDGERPCELTSHFGRLYDSN